MSVRTRLILSYIAMLVVPIILSILATMIIFVFYAKGFEHSYNLKLGKKTSVEQLVGRDNYLFDNIRSTVEKSPDSLKDTSYLKDLDSKFSSSDSGIVVRKGKEVIYASSLINSEKILKHLPAYKGFSNGERGRSFIDDRIVKQIDFHFTDGSEGSVFSIMDVSFIKNTVTKFAITVIFVIIGILILTNAILTFLVSRSILKPLKVLKDGAVEIKNGNLDFAVEVTSKDEIGEVCSAFEDMRVRLKDSLKLQQQYENNRKELISSISHDLKTPITAIKGYVEGIKDGVANSTDKMDRYIETIATKASDLDRLIDELFIFSKLDLNKLPFNIEDFDIKKYLEDCVEELQLDFEDKGIFISFKDLSSNKTLIVSADREKLKRVITNIVVNAVKYMDKEYGKIDVELKEFDSFVQIKIEDNGKGISKEDLVFIFDRFYRVDHSRNTSTGGSGLGLAIAKLIVEEQGGHIWAKSELEKGTALFFTIKKSEIQVIK